MISLTDRGRLIILALLFSVPVLWLRSLFRFWPDSESGFENMVRRLEHMCGEKLIAEHTAYAQAGAVERFYHWAPGMPAPDFGALGWALAKRWERLEPRRVTFYTATEFAARHYGRTVRNPLKSLSALAHNIGLGDVWAQLAVTDPILARSAWVAGGCFCGLGCVLFAAHLYATWNPGSDHSGYILLAGPHAPYPPTGVGGLLPFAGILSFATGILFVTTALDSFRLVNPLPVVRIAWDALCVFFTYPEVDHPLTHRLCQAWLRPMSLRVALAALVLATIASAAMPRTSRSETLAAGSKEERANATYPPYASSSSTAPPLPQGDIDLAMIEGRSVSHAIGTFPSATTSTTRNPDPAAGETTAPASGSFEARATAFAITAAAIALGAPLGVYLMVCLLGIAALSVHSGYFEKPEALPS